MKLYGILTMFLLLSLPCLVAQASEMSPCVGTPALITASSQDDRELACDAVVSTLQLAQRFDMEIPPRLDIEVVDKLDSQYAAKRFGEFDPFEGKILVMSSSACKLAAQNWKPFGQQITPMLQRSLIVHEVAHAVADWNFKVSEPNFLAHEYIAYVFQISSMPKDLQSAILKHVEVPAFQDIDEINDIYYGLNPDYFGVKSYRHFMQTKERKALLHRFLAGEVIGDW
jgi:hypothetical protein